MERTGIIVAMDKEMAQLRRLLTDEREELIGGQLFVTGRVGDSDVVATKCGIGKVNAAMGAMQLITHHHPRVVISTGVAGGADPSLSVMDVVVASETAYHDVYCGQEVAYGQVMGQPARYAAPTELVERAVAAGPEGHTRAGLTVSGDWFVDSREKMRSILDHFPDALACDMESCAIAQVCHAHATPFVSIRIISDVPLSDHRASQYYDFWDRLADGSFHVLENIINHQA